MAARRIKGGAAQPGLFDAAHARSTDPETSHEAAAKVTPYLPQLQQLVLATLSVYGPMIDRKLVSVLKTRHGRTDSTWRTRRSELVAKGLVMACGKVDGHTLWKVRDDG